MQRYYADAGTPIRGILTFTHTLADAAFDVVDGGGDSWWAGGRRDVVWCSAYGRYWTG